MLERIYLGASWDMRWSGWMEWIFNARTVQTLMYRHCIVVPRQVICHCSKIFKLFLYSLVDTQITLSKLKPPNTSFNSSYLYQRRLQTRFSPKWSNNSKGHINSCRILVCMRRQINCALADVSRTIRGHLRLWVGIYLDCGQRLALKSGCGRLYFEELRWRR